MTRGIFTILSFVSVLFFPWPLTAFLAVATSFFEPLVPLAVGIFVDTLYYSPSVETIPFFIIYGAIVSIVAFFVRRRVKAGIISE